MKNPFRLGAVLLWLAFSLTACSDDTTTAVSYTAYNHTDKSVVSTVINGEGGILNVGPHGGGGGDICCVVIPRKWRPGLKATIKWQLDGHWVRDEKGQIVVKDGHDQFVEGEWKERTVEVPEYDEQLGQFFIHFMPNDEVKVAVSPYGPRNPKHPYRFPDIPLINP